MLSMFPEVAYAKGVFDIVRDRIASDENESDAGVSTVEWILISALLVTLVLAVGVILYNKWTAKATSIPTNTP